MFERVTRSPALFALLLLVCAVLGAAAVVGIQALGAGEVGAGDKARIEKVVHAYLLEHPEVLPEAIEKLRSNETGKAVEANRAAIFEPFPGAQAGNPKGDVTLVAYMDYACGYCRASLPVVAQLIASDPKLRVVYREYPILSPQSETAARWSLAAAQQGKFQRFHDAVYAGGRLSEDTIAAAANRAGLDLAKARQSLGSPAIQQELVRNHQIGNQLGLSGTPSWVIGDKVISGVAEFGTLQAAIASLRSGK